MSEGSRPITAEQLISKVRATRGPVLVVEDDIPFSKMIIKLFTANHFDVVLARDGVEGLQLARERHPDVVVTDWMMPRLNGMELCEAIRADATLQATYIILLSNHHDTREKVLGLERGADDYLAKTVPTEELVARVEAGMRIRILQRALVRQATTDPLTDLCNRAHFFRRFADEIERTARYGQPLTLAMVDLDGLKDINDELGHLAGDAAIRHVARFLESQCRNTDIVARWGGDEFAILFVATTTESAHTIMTRLEAEIRKQPAEYEGRLLPVALSFGLSACDPQLSTNPDVFVKEADGMLYEMKRRHHEVST